MATSAAFAPGRPPSYSRNPLLVGDDPERLVREAGVGVADNRHVEAGLGEPTVDRLRPRGPRNRRQLLEADPEPPLTVVQRPLFELPGDVDHLPVAGSWGHCHVRVDVEREHRGVERLLAGKGPLDTVGRQEVVEGDRPVHLVAVVEHGDVRRLAAVRGRGSDRDPVARQVAGQRLESLLGAVVVVHGQRSYPVSEVFEQWLHVSCSGSR